MIYMGLFLAGLSFKAAAAADTTLQLKPVLFVAGAYKDVYADNLNNIYLITAANQVKKVSDSGDSLAVYNDVRRYGNLYSMDVSNPLKIIVYYKDFTTLAVLDRFLNLQQTIDLRKTGILQATAVAQSYDNNYWVFDEVDNKIKKIDDAGTVIFESADFRVVFPEAVRPGKLIDNNGLLYLYDEHKGWYLFDYYGAYKLHIPAAGWKDVQVIGKLLTGRDSVSFKTCDPVTMMDRTYAPGEAFTSAIKITRFGNKVAFLKSDGLHIFDIQQNN